jgi:hypothetical protein
VARPSQARIAPPFGSACGSATRNLRPRRRPAGPQSSVVAQWPIGGTFRRVRPKLHDGPSIEMAGLAVGCRACLNQRTDPVRSLL